MPRRCPPSGLPAAGTFPPAPRRLPVPRSRKSGERAPFPAARRGCGSSPPAWSRSGGPPRRGSGFRGRGRDGSPGRERASKPTRIPRRRGRGRRTERRGGGTVSWSAPGVPGGTDVAFRVHAEPFEIREFDSKRGIETEEKSLLSRQPKLDGAGKPQLFPERLARVRDLRRLHVHGETARRLHGLREVCDDGANLKVHRVDERAA